jgi:Sec23/Sec24 trunk domain
MSASGSQWALIRSCRCRLQVSVDVFAVSQTYVDLATLGTLCETTGGEVYHYAPFNARLDFDQLWNDLRWNVIRPQVRLVAGYLHSFDLSFYIGAQMNIWHAHLNSCINFAAAFAPECAHFTKNQHYSGMPKGNCIV